MSEHSSRLNKLARNLYGVWFWAVFICLSLPTLCLVALIPDQHRCRSVARWSAGRLLRLTGAWPAVSGLHLLPDTASVVVANHASYLDGILLTAVLPHRYRYVIKREITQVPLVGFFLRRIGAHFVDRYDPKRGASDARRIIQTANDGASLAFFPEGTFLREPGLRRFHNGAFTIATRSKMPLIPITIRGTRKMLPAHQWLARPARLAVIISEPLETANDMDASTAREYCRKQILQTLNEPDLQA